MPRAGTHEAWTTTGKHGVVSDEGSIVGWTTVNRRDGSSRHHPFTTNKPPHARTTLQYTQDTYVGPLAEDNDQSLVFVTTAFWFVLDIVFSHVTTGAQSSSNHDAPPQPADIHVAGTSA
jgi:hypothetical protein